MFLADFHVHSTFSDGKLLLPDVIDMYGKRGFGCIAITDHLCEAQTFLGKASSYLDCTLTPANFPLYMNLLETEAQRAWDQYKMVVLKGFELTKNSVSNHRSAHLLGIGITEYIDADQDPLQLARAVRAQGALAIAAHPVWTRKLEKQTYHLWDRLEELRGEFDAWEVASGPFLFPEVVDQRLPKIASSDLHLARHMTSWKTALTCERHPEAILDAVRRQQIEFVFYDDKPEEFRIEQNVDRGAAPFVGHRRGDDAVGNLVCASAG